jgi:hypothetical protein
MRLYPPCEIFLCGDDKGVAETAREFNVQHIPDIEKNEHGTPLLSSAFNVVRKKAGNTLLCYVNADIILLNDVISAVKTVPFKRFLLVGQRWNLNINDPIDFDCPSWEKDLREKLVNEAELQAPFGSDYFIFPNDIDWNFPEFAVGRPGWDNWFIYRARSFQIPVIDATEGGTVIHQNHNYSHIPGGINSKSFEGPEADQNRNLVGGEEYSFNINDATHRIVKKSIVRSTDFQNINYRLARQRVLHSSMGELANIRWKILYAMFYRRRFLPKWLWKNIIYALTK